MCATTSMAIASSKNVRSHGGYWDNAKCNFSLARAEQFVRLGRNLCSPKLTIRLKTLLEQPENFSGAAARLVDCFRNYLIAIKIRRICRTFQGESLICQSGFCWR